MPGPSPSAISIMELTIQRLEYTDNSTIGELSIDGVFLCWTLEPKKDQSKGKPYCIPSGTYNVTLVMSARFQMVTPHILGVPGFTDIEVHPGNYPTDTEGCTLVGETKEVDFVGLSRAAFALLMSKLVEPITAIYVG